MPRQKKFKFKIKKIVKKIFFSTLCSIGCCMAFMQPAQAQNNSYNAVQNFSDGWTIASPSPAADGGGSYTRITLSNPPVGIGSGNDEMIASSANARFGGYYQDITSPIGSDSMAYFNGGSHAYGEVLPRDSVESTYSIIFNSLPPAGTQLNFIMYVVNPLTSSYPTTNTVTPPYIGTTTLRCAITNTNNSADTLSTTFSAPVTLQALTSSPTNTVGATGWTEINGQFTVPQCVTSVTLTILDSIPAQTRGSDFMLGGIALSTSDITDPFTAGSVTPDEQATGCPLPITGLQLTAQPKGNTVNLSWGTLTEINSKNFTVQRSADNGKTWVTVAAQPTKAVNGNSSVPLSYTAQDIVLQSGEYEYRVVETDIDGSTTTSNIATVNITANGSAVYPNPAKDYINVMLTASANNVPYRLISSDGKIVLSGTMTNAGNHGTIEVAGIASGVYFLQVTVNNTTQTYEVQIQQ